MPGDFIAHFTARRAPTACTNGDCPRRAECFTYLTTLRQGEQALAIKDNVCEFFSPVRPGDKLRTK